MPPITALQTCFHCEKREQPALLHFFLYFIQGRKTSGVRVHLTNQRNLLGVVVMLLEVQKVRHSRASAKVYVNRETNNSVPFVKNLSYLFLPREKHKSTIGFLTRLRCTTIHPTFDKHFALYVETQQQCLAKAPMKFQNFLLQRIQREQFHAKRPNTFVKLRRLTLQIKICKKIPVRI